MKYNFLLDSSIRIPLKYSDQYWFQKIQNSLLRKEKSYNGQIEETKEYYFTYNDQELLVPRFYDVQKFGISLTRATCKGDSIDITSNIAPRDQKQKEAIEWFCQNKHGVLCMNPGEGKTIVTIAAMCYYRVKSIIFVHKNGLINQWKDRICQFTNLEEKDIAFLSTTTYKEDLKYPVVLATVHTFNYMAQKIPNLLDIMKSANYGFSVWDECHTSVSAEKFSISSLFTPADKTFGLSATPERRDGNSDIISLHLGPVYEPQKDSDYTMNPKVVLLKFDHEIMSSEGDRKYIMWGGKFDKSKYLKKLCKSKKYLSVMKKIVRKAEFKSRNLLFLAERIKILDEVSKGVNDQEQVGFFIPRSGKERDEHLQRKFVFSTYLAARDGTDKQELDFMVLGTPTSNVKQCTGRVQRYIEGKRKPVVIDVIDTGCNEMLNRADKRIEKYQEWDWEIIEDNSI